MSTGKKEQISFLQKIKYLGKALQPKDKFILYTAIFLALFGIMAGSFKYYLNVTKTVPTRGGEYVEGIAVDSSGIPTNINPLLSVTRPTDELLTSLIYSSLFRYDRNGQIIGDLVEKYEISEDGKKYTLHLKPNLTWHDGEQLTADDVIFTINLLQDPGYNPAGPKEWDKEKTKISKIDDRTISINLSEPYAPFLNKLTFGILPKHLWSGISNDKFALTDLNLKPVGSGPFIFDEMKTNDDGDIISYKLISNENYYEHVPYLEHLIFNFYPNKEAVREAYNRKEISGFDLTDYDTIPEFQKNNESNVFTLRIPQYFFVFLNQGESVPLADIKVRQALRLATDKDELVNSIFHGFADKIHSPLLKPFVPQDFNYDNKLTKYDPEEAKKILEEAGWKQTDDGSRKKNDTELKIQLVTAATKDLNKTGELLKKQWEKIGVKVEVITAENYLEIQQKYLTPRKYEALISGFQYSGNDPNLFFLWHSSGKKAPGLNFAMYDNSEVDKLLEEAKKAKTREEENEKYIQAVKYIIDETPAIFLYNPKYVYIINKKIHGFDNDRAIIKTSNRLDDAVNWYIKTKRVKK